MSNILISLFLTALAAFAGCKQAGDKSRSNPAPAVTDQQGNVTQGTCLTYTQHIAPIIQSKCTSCHSPSGPNSDISTFQTVQVKVSSIVNRAITLGNMPPVTSGLSLLSTEKTQLQNWARNPIQNSSECVSTNNGINNGNGTTPGGTTTTPGSASQFVGTAADVQYSQSLWQALTAAKMVGPDAVGGVLFNGSPPHGTVREIISGTVTVNGHRGRVYVKHNYDGAGVNLSSVEQNRQQWLKADTVIFERESTFDPSVKNLFWVKYTPTGGLHKDTNNVSLAGRIGKGTSEGCIGCHQNAQGGDYFYWNDQ